MLDPLQFYCRVLCNGMKTRFRMVMIAHPGPGIGFHKQFMWQIIILPTTDIPTVHKTPLGTGMGCACLSGQHGVWFLVVAGASWGCTRSVVNLAISPHASANPTIPQQIVCLHEGLSLQVTQGGAEHTDELAQKGNSAGGCDVVARARRAEERPWGGARESQSTGNS